MKSLRRPAASSSPRAACDVRSALEEFAVGQDGKTGAPRRCVALRDRSGIEVFAQHAPRGTRALDFAASPPGAQRPASPERAGEIARR